MKIVRVDWMFESIHSGGRHFVGSDVCPWKWSIIKSILCESCFTDATIPPNCPILYGIGPQKTLQRGGAYVLVPPNGHFWDFLLGRLGAGLKMSHQWRITFLGGVVSRARAIKWRCPLCVWDKSTMCMRQVHLKWWEAPALRQKKAIIILYIFVFLWIWLQCHKPC